MKPYTLVDLTKDRSGKDSYLSHTLIDHIQTALNHGKKSLLYLNKRGAYHLLICQDCQHIFSCPHCDVSLSVHFSPKKLKCHHCFYETPYPLACEVCHGTHLKTLWVGTQQIEDHLRKLFPEKKIFRMDRDNVANKSQKALASQMLHQADIIIGTKMITTGYDLKDVGVIGVIMLEQEIASPLYDTEERAFQNIKQLLGRWGRLGVSTTYIIQTCVPENPELQRIINSNYKDFFKETLASRKLFGYPPFLELATLTYRHLSREKSIEYTKSLFEKFSQDPKKDDIEIRSVLTPYKLQKFYQTKIILKGKNLRAFLETYRKEILQNRNLSVTFYR